MQVRVLLRSGESRAVQLRHGSVTQSWIQTAFVRAPLVTEPFKTLSLDQLLSSFACGSAPVVIDVTADRVDVECGSHVEQTPWRNWIAHWTSNPEVAGSNPVGVASREISDFQILDLVMDLVEPLAKW